MKRPTFVDDEIYHAYNRGVEKRKIFLTEKDYLRFIHDMYEFNDERPAFNSGFHFGSLLKSDFNSIFRGSRKPLVEILCFCLMPNHYHFLIRQLIDGGITEFMRKIGAGYTNYFNTKYDRVGPLFQGKFKAVHVTKEAHLLYLPHYIHLNPLDLTMPEWREQRIRSPEKALKFLESYRWSSYLDHIGKKNYPSVTQRDFILNNHYRSPTSIVDYRKEIRQWLEDIDLAQLQEVAIEPTIEVGLR